MKGTHTLSTIFSKFKHIGEVNLFEYILTDLDQRTMRFDYNNAKAKLIEEKIELAPSSQFRYLRSMVENGILSKVQKGVYKVNEEWVGYGTNEK